MATAALFRFDELSSEVYAVDDAEKSEDLGGDTESAPDLVIPDTADSLTGRGRVFGPDIGLQGPEVVSDALRLTRDFTVRALMLYEIDAALDGDKGTVAARGRSGSAAERLILGAEIERVDAATLRLRARWQEAGGAEAVLGGATFVPEPGKYFSLAVVRQWLDTGTVQVFYAVNDILIGTETVAAGDIGEGVGGTLTVGCAGDGLGNYERFLPAGSIIDQVSIESDAMSFEEIRQDFRRVFVHQPNGYRILRSYIPPGEAMSREPSSSIQKWIAAEGDALGFVLAQGERLREDFMPDRAYGAALEAWEKLCKLSPKPLETVAERRLAVMAALRKTLGLSPDALKTALEPLLGLASSDIEIFEFGAVRADGFATDDITTPPSKMWRTLPGNGTIAIAAGVCSLAVPAATPNCQWYKDPTGAGGAPFREVCVSAVDGGPVDPYGAALVVDVDATVGVDAVDVLCGLFFRNAQGDAIFFGSMDTGSGYELASFSIVDGVRSAVTGHAAGGAGVDQIVLRFVSTGLFEVASITGGVATVYSSAVAGPSSLVAGDNKGVRWGGICCVSRDVASAQQDADFDDFQVFEPETERGLNFLVYRDPALPGTYNVDKAQAQLDKQEPAHTWGAVSTQRHLILGDGGRLGVDLLYPTD